MEASVVTPPAGGSVRPVGATGGIAVTGLPHDDPGDDPTAGTPSGRHRVLEPAGVLPASASRLDPHPDLWDTEARVVVTHLVLSPADLGRLRAAHGPDGATVRAALLESTAERGGLTDLVEDAVLVGTLAARGPRWAQDVRPGTIVATTAPPTSIAAWLSDLSGWDGASLVAPCRGHAILSSGSAVVAFSGATDAMTAALMAREAAVPTVVADVTVPGDRVAVLGATTAAGGLAAIAAVLGGAELVAGLVTSLQDARLARALGVAEPIVADVSRPSEAAAALAEALGGPADVVAVAVDDPDAVRTAVVLAEDGTILLLHGSEHARLAVGTAQALGTSPVVRVDRPAVRDAGATLTALVTSNPTLMELFRWRAGVGPAPAATRPEDV